MLSLIMHKNILGVEKPHVGVIYRDQNGHRCFRNQNVVVALGTKRRCLVAVLERNPTQHYAA